MVMTTFSDKGEAEKMATSILSARLAACAQISSGISSYYWWNNAIDNSNEYILSLKTQSKIFQDLEKYIADNHSYDTPEIIAISLSHVSDAYGEWIIQETEGKQ